MEGEFSRYSKAFRGKPHIGGRTDDQGVGTAEMGCRYISRVSLIIEKVQRGVKEQGMQESWGFEMTLEGFPVLRGWN